jgi:Lrp/AsnC family leucine-responsive transcriptional regulator
MKIDGFDRSILNFLQSDARIAASHIADELKISIPTVTERIKKLMEAGVIKGFHASIDPKMLGLDISAIITIISESSEHYKEVIKLAKETSEVIQCFSTTGKVSHTLIVIANNSQALEELLRKIQSWPGVSRTETQVILSSYDINKSSYEIN